MPKGRNKRNSVIEIKAPDEEGAEEHMRQSIKGTDPKKIAQEPSQISTGQKTKEKPAKDKKKSAEKIEENLKPHRGGSAASLLDESPAKREDEVPGPAKEKPEPAKEKPEPAKEKPEAAKEEPDDAKEEPLEVEEEPPQDSEMEEEPKNTKCDSTPDLYSKVLGPTADEIILKGLNALWDLTDKIKNRRGGGEGSNMNAGKESPSVQRIKPSCVPKKRKDGPRRNCECQTTMNVASRGHQASAQVCNSGIQADTTPEIVQVFQCQQTELEMANKEIQNDLLTDPDRRENKSVFTTTSLENQKCDCCVQTKHYNCNCGCQTEQMEKVKEVRKTCKCSRCEIDPLTGVKPDDVIVTRGAGKTDTTYLKDHSCMCETSPDEVRYALVRISRFAHFLTYEILKSTKRKPKKMPKCVEGTFVVRELDEEGCVCEK